MKTTKLERDLISILEKGFDLIWKTDEFVDSVFTTRFSHYLTKDMEETQSFNNDIKQAEQDVADILFLLFVKQQVIQQSQLGVGFGYYPQF